MGKRDIGCPGKLYFPRNEEFAFTEDCINDADIVDHFKQIVHDTGGGNYQTLINEALREHLQPRGERLENRDRSI